MHAEVLMLVRRAIVVGLVGVALAGCAPQHANTSVMPRRGPETSIYATYSGGYMHRALRAQFRVDRAAFVMVGHLGGDGRVQVLYPDNAIERGRIDGGRTYATPTFFANYDASPGLYSFLSPPMRSIGAQLDSYDGAGHGYIFIIASAQPMDFELLSESGLWEDFTLSRHSQSYDPRFAIRSLADALTQGSDYTLDFADSFGTFGHTTRADAMYDCAVLSSLGFASYVWVWSPMSSWMYTNYYGAPACGRRPHGWLGPYYYVNNDVIVVASTPVRRTYSPHTPVIPRETIGFRRRANDRAGVDDFVRPRTGGGRRESGTATGGRSRSDQSTSTARRGSTRAGGSQRSSPAREGRAQSTTRKQ
jgi:hypothetical protein